jgi:hypothetical protein
MKKKILPVSTTKKKRVSKKLDKQSRKWEVVFMPTYKPKVDE